MDGKKYLTHSALTRKMLWQLLYVENKKLLMLFDVIATEGNGQPKGITTSENMKKICENQSRQSKCEEIIVTLKISKGIRKFHENLGIRKLWLILISMYELIERVLRRELKKAIGGPQNNSQDVDKMY